MDIIYFVEVSDNRSRGRYMVIRKFVYDSGQIRRDMDFGEFFPDFDEAKVRCDQLNAEEKR